MKKEKLIERKHVKGRGSAWTSGSSEYGKPPLRFCPLRLIEGTASSLAGKSRGPGFSQCWVCVTLTVAVYIQKGFKHGSREHSHKDGV